MAERGECESDRHAVCNNKRRELLFRDVVEGGEDALGLVAKGFPARERKVRIGGDERRVAGRVLVLELAQWAVGPGAAVGLDKAGVGSGREAEPRADDLGRLLGAEERARPQRRDPERDCELGELLCLSPARGVQRDRQATLGAPRRVVVGLAMAREEDSLKPRRLWRPRPHGVAVSTRAFHARSGGSIPPGGIATDSNARVKSSVSAAASSSSVNHSTAAVSSPSARGSPPITAASKIVET